MKNNVLHLKRDEITLAMFNVVVGRSDCGKWQWQQLSAFTKYIANLPAWKEKEFARTEKEWWTLFDQFCESQPATQRSVKRK